MTEPSIDISHSSFKSFTHSSNGGVIYINNKKISVFSCLFASCSSETYDGGCMYCISPIKIITSKNCILDCIAKNGQFIFSSMSSSIYSSLEMNHTISFNCTGNERAVCHLTKTNLISRYYNSSSCNPKIRCNIALYTITKSNSAYYQIFNCINDILYSVCSGQDDNELTYTNIINNTKRAGDCALIHINSQSGSLVVDHFCSYLNNHKIFQSYSGSLTIKNFMGNSFSCFGDGEKITSNIITNDSYVLETLFARRNICNIYQRCKSKRVRCTTHSSFVLFMLMLIVY